jgi:exodeoxyribonuclease V gamma subunit
MFLHQSNRLEALFAQFHAVLGQPPDDPLAPEIVVVHNQGMAQWVAQQLALSAGIAANVQFPLPARFIWDLMQRVTGTLPEEDRFRKSVLRWRIAALLPDLAGDPAFAEIAAYLRDDGNGVKAQQLASRISDVFDQYQVYRTDMLTRWEQGGDDHWQARLWRALTADGLPPRARLTEQFQALLGADSDAVLPPAALPRRVHLFGLNSLAPTHLESVARISRHSEVHLYHLSPCRHYWGDLVSARQRARMRKKNQENQGEAADAPDVSEAFDASDSYYEQGHPLLVSLGRTGQDFFRQLLDCDLEDIDLYQESEQSHLLAALHNDILDLRDRAAEGEQPYLLEAGDRSIQFHCCFSPLREIQVLHDRLLDLFQVHPDLTPGDVLVSAPDIGLYADAIAGVFGEAAQERRIPWSIADQSLAREQPLARCFLDLLALFSGRFTAPAVLALCETPALLRRFGLDPAILPRLHAWVRDAGIRWGLDASHRRELDVPAGNSHSWRFGLDRLLLGYLMGDCREPYAHLLPYGNLGGSESAELGGFVRLIDTLAQWRLRLRQPCPAEEWCAALLRLLDDCFEPEEEGLQPLREAINNLRADCRLADHHAPLAPAVIAECLETALSQPDGGQPFLSGRVTFCNMVPMRSVPFRAVCLLGLNDQDFPRSQHPVAFDLIASQPRLGDRNRRNDDRYLFLEALLSARDVLYLSWVGRNQRDDSLAPPSVVVSELRDYLDQSCRVADAAEVIATRVSEHLTTLHPMQPFSRRCFNGDAATASYNPSWLPADRLVEPTPFLSAPLPAPDEEQRRVDLQQLARFWRHPVRCFLEQSLGLNLRAEAAAVEESEPFVLDSLQQYQLRRETILERLSGLPVDQILGNLEGAGSLPQGGFGRVQFAGIAASSDQFADQLRPLLASPLPPLEIDRIIGPFRLTGWLGDLHPEGRVTWRTGALKGADLIELWVYHLCLNLLAPAGLPHCSLHLARDKAQANTPARLVRLKPVADPEPQLLQLLERYWQGLSQPLPFFPETGLAWARAAGTGKEEARARQIWESGFQRNGEGDDPAYGYFFSPAELPLSAEFVDLSSLFGPILDHLEDDHAAA